MADSPNRLSDTQSQLTSINTQGSWVANNLNISNSDNSTLRSGEYKQLAISIIDPNIPNSLELKNVLGFIDDYKIAFDLSFAVQMQTGGTITVRVQETVYNLLNFVDEIKISSETTSSFLVTQFESIVETARWSIVRTKSFYASPVSSGLAPSFNISLEFAPAAGEVVLFTSPALCGVLDFAFYNTVYYSIKANLPEWLGSSESSTTKPPLQLSKFIDMGSRYLDYASEYLNDYQFVDEVNGLDSSNSETKSLLVNPDVANFQTLLWLLPFVFTKPITRYTLSAENVLTPFILDVSLLDSTAKLSLVSVGSVVTATPTVTRETQTNLLRWQAKYGYYGAFAGTLDGLRESVKQVLTGNKTVTATFDYETEPWVIDLTTPWNETFGGAQDFIGQPSLLVLQAASYSKPIGVLLRHEMTAAV